MDPGRHAPDLTCSLPPAELRARRTQLQRELAPAVLEIEPTSGGYRFWFDATAQRLAQIAELIAFEKECCAFLDFALELRAGAGRVALTLSGPADARPIIEALFVDATRPPG